MNLKKNSCAQPCGKRNIAVLEFLQVKFHWLAMDAHIRDASPSRDNGLTDSEGGWKPDCLDGHVDASPLREFHYLMGGVSICVVDQSGCAKLFCDREAPIVQIDHENRRR